MKRTGVFATEEEAKKIGELAGVTSTTPAIAINLPGGGPASWAWQDVYRACHAAALSHGLPEVRGFYGIDLKNREFLTE